MIPRISRKDLGTPFLHLMVQGINKEYIFKTSNYIKKYLKLLNKFSEEYEITILAYCIMNNHAHILTYTEDVEQLSKCMHKINTIYSHFYNRIKDRYGVVFRNRYKTEPIYDIKHLINCIRYIHMNPVKAKIIDTAEKYPYSSADEYMKKGKIIRSKIMEEIFGAKYDYSYLVSFESKYMFIDDEQPSHADIRKYMDIGINEFLTENNINLIKVMENREILVKIIKYLNEEYKFRYKDIAEKFAISIDMMRNLK